MPDPFDPSWEIDLIQSVLEFPTNEHTTEALNTVESDWFIHPIHRVFWKIVKGVEKDGDLEDSAVYTALRRAKLSDQDKFYLENKFISGHRHTGSAKAPLAAVREAHFRRQVLKAGEALSRSGGDFGVSLDELERIATKAGDLGSFQGDREDLKERDLSESVQKFLDGQALVPYERQTSLIKLGLPSLDQILIAGPGRLGVLSAKTSAGKTSLAIQAAVRTQASGLQTAYVSLEMDRDELEPRLLANATGIPSHQIERKGKCFEDFEQIYLNDVKKILTITKIPGRSFSSLCSKIRYLARKRGVKLVIVDYFTLINPPDLKKTNANIAYQLGEMSKGFKALASDLGIHILLISQLNRTVGDAERPTLEALRDTGQLEQDANYVIFMWTESKTYGPYDSRKVFIEVAKNRGGPRWVKTQAMFDPTNCRFKELEQNVTNNYRENPYG